MRWFIPIVVIALLFLMWAGWALTPLDIVLLLGSRS